MVVVLLVAASREPVSEGGELAFSKDSCPAEILRNEEVFHRSENLYVSHFVLPSDLYDLPQISHHESV